MQRARSKAETGLRGVTPGYGKNPYVKTQKVDKNISAESVQMNHVQGNML